MMHEGAYAWVWPWKYTARVRSIHDEQLYENTTITSISIYPSAREPEKLLRIHYIPKTKKKESEKKTKQASISRYIVSWYVRQGSCMREMQQK